MQEVHKENSWLAKLKKSPNETLREIYSTYRKEFVQWLISRYNCSQEDAEDFFQETLIIFFNNTRTGKLTTLTSTLKTYLFAIGKNLALKANLKPKKANIDVEVIAHSVEVDNLYFKQLAEEELDERKKKILLGLQKLKDPCKSILFAFYYQQLPLKQIAENMGYNNHDVVKTQKYRCMSKFLKSFK